MRRVLTAAAVMTWIAVSAEAQSLFSLEGANIRLESQAPKSAQASPMVPGSS